MRLGWFGVPWYAYAIGCLLVAVSYIIFTIEPTKGYNWTAKPVWRFVILRWFHSLVWVLLATACLTMQRKGEQGIIWAKSISFIGLLIYLLYLLFFFIEKDKSTS